MAYRLIFSYDTVPVVKFKFNRILLLQNVLMNATESYADLGGSNIYTGLVFEWTCPPIFQTVCENQMNNRFLSINFNQFYYSTANFAQEYNFTLSVWRLVNLNGGTGGTQIVIPLSWYNVGVPDFEVRINGDKIFTT